MQRQITPCNYCLWDKNCHVLAVIRTIDDIALMHFDPIYQLEKLRGVILNKSDMPVFTLLAHMGQVSDIAYVVDQYV